MTLSELVAQSHELVPHRAILDAAEHTLVIARGKPYGPEQAFHELLSVATQHRIAVLTLARALIDVSQTREQESLPTDLPHTVAVAEWGAILDLPTRETLHTHDLHTHDTDGLEIDGHPADEPAVDYLLSTDLAGRIVFVSLAFTIAAIVGFFAHDWALLLLVTAASTAWAAVALTMKVLRASHTRRRSITNSYRPNTQASNNSHRHTVAA
ncbi:ANTAR domain-containing protein [Rhodococcus sp. NPDC056743]|uniref:ANTAR domain-containing protein n=1 Tax=Rhodococcus sp. NPDC056743 TaxID=3345934 RepID=UPI0036735332